MTQQVNLYTAELRPSTEPMQAGTLVLVLALAMIALAASAVFVRYQAQEIEARVQTVQAQIRQIEARVGKLTDELEAQQVDPRTIDAVARVTADVAQRQRLLAEVAQLVGNKDSRFSPYLQAFARQIPDQVWLTGFRVNLINNRVRFSGRAGAGDQVPVYLERLGEEAVFSGRRFERLNLQRSESGRWIDFDVASSRAGEEGS
ncbi:MAG: PilN domain-containing protein [Oleiphilaceae bacterium]|nr:PilN domain-containing protein [Oleiphilaceae bacterium]